MGSRKPKKTSRSGIQGPRRLFKRERDPEGLRGEMPAVPPGTRVVINPAGREKMSEVLEEFVEPFRESADDEDTYRKLLTLGVLAWNVALLPEAEKRQEALERMIAEGFPHASLADRAAARQVVETLIQRKDRYFAKNQRVIFSFKLTDTGDDLHLNVASSL